MLFPAGSTALTVDGPLVPRYPLIALEGIDGSGKNSLLRALADQFSNCTVLTFPGTTPAGEEIRARMKDAHEVMTDDLIVAALAYNLEDVIISSIEPTMASYAENVMTSKSTPVDRGFFQTKVTQYHALLANRWPHVSGLVYQETAFSRLCELHPEALFDRANAKYGALWPSVIIYLDVSVETSVARRPVSPTDRFENCTDRRARYQRRYGRLMEEIMSRPPEVAQYRIPSVIRVDNNMHVGRKDECDTYYIDTATKIVKILDDNLKGAPHSWVIDDDGVRAVRATK